MGGAATAAIAGLPQGGWIVEHRHTVSYGPGVPVYKCALCHAGLQRRVPSCEHISLQESALSSGKRECRWPYKRGKSVPRITRGNGETALTSDTQAGVPRHLRSGGCPLPAFLSVSRI